jgi:potassium uptake TrkH family protein
VRHPARAIALAFAVAVAGGTLLLLLPPARAGPGGAPFLTALFTSTSAVCVTGLTTVDTATYWSPFGQVVILGLVQVGGFGIMSGASVLFVLVARRLSLRRRLLYQAETRTLELGGLRRVVLGVLVLTVVVEAVTTLALGLRLWLGHGHDLPSAAWRGFYHAVSAFNNAGFALWSDSLIGFVDDPGVILPIVFAVLAGGLGFPVWLELARKPRRARRWSLHTKLTLAASGALTVGGVGAVTAFEWGNPDTLGPLGPGGKVLGGLLQGISPRTGGFSSVDYAKVEPETVLSTDMLMFVGGGSASTAGGITVTTLSVLFLIVWAEVRGAPEVEVFHRRIPRAAQRQALAIAVASMNLVVLGAMALMTIGGTEFSSALFESISAFGTAGVSTGITGGLPDAGQVVLIALMYLGRVGPVTLGVALVLRERDRRYGYPEERPLVG